VADLLAKAYFRKRGYSARITPPPEPVPVAELGEV
jgi:hypothetical protein